MAVSKYYGKFPGHTNYQQPARKHENHRSPVDGWTTKKRIEKKAKSGFEWRKTLNRERCAEKISKLNEIGIDAHQDLGKLTTKQLIGLNGLLSQALL